MSTDRLYQAILPSIITTAIAGLSSIYLTKTKDKIKKLQTTNLLKLVTLLHLTIYSYNIYLAVYNYKSNKIKVSYNLGVRIVGLVFQYTILIFFFYTAYFLHVPKSDRICQIIEKIEGIDKIFNDLGECFDYNKHLRYDFISMFPGLLTISLNFLNINLNRNEKYLLGVLRNLYLINVWPTYVLYILMTQFVNLVRLIHVRFKRINTNLSKRFIGGKSEKILVKNKKIIVNYQQNSGKEYEYSHALKRIEILMELHDSLTDIGNELNKTFTVQLLIGFCAIFITLVFAIFSIYYDLTIREDKPSAISWIIWLGITGIVTVHVIIICHKTAAESKNTGTEIHKVLLDETNTHIKAKLMTFSQQIRHCPLQFTACRMFVIDGTLLFTIIGGAATYLLITLQFQEGIESQCGNPHTL